MTSDSVAEPSAAEELAGSVFQFVNSAVSLGSTLRSVGLENEDDGTGSLRLPLQGDKSAEDSSKTSPEESEEFHNESQVQLLRLRIKSREIIIFPDPQYLCCVVQKVGNQSGTSEYR